MSKNIGGIIFLILGLIGLYASWKGYFIYEEKISAVGAAGFSIALIAIAISKLFFNRGFFDLNLNSLKIRIVYAIASAGMALACISYTLSQWNKSKVFALIAGIGVVFFMSGIFVILFYDYKKINRNLN